MNWKGLKGKYRLITNEENLNEEIDGNVGLERSEGEPTENEEREIGTGNMDELSMEDQNTVREILETMKTREFADYKDFKKVDYRRLKNITGNVNRLLRYIEVRDITEINYLIRAGTTYVAKALGMKRKKNERTEPWWKRRIQENIKILRRDVNMLERKTRGQLKNERKYKELDRRYKIARKGLDVV